MPVIFQHHIKRSDLVRNHDPDHPLANVLYVFGDNMARVGLGGQAKEMRHEPNAVGVATKYSPEECFGEEPAQVVAQKRVIDRDMKPLFAHVKEGGVVIWPSRGIGTERANMEMMAPSTWDYLQAKLAALLRVAKLYDRGASHARIAREVEGHE